MLQFFSFLEVPHKILVYFMCVNITLQSIAIENGTEEGTRPIESAKERSVSRVRFFFLVCKEFVEIFHVIHRVQIVVSIAIGNAVEECVAVCCSVLRCGAVCCSVLQCVAG